MTPVSNRPSRYLYPAFFIVLLAATVATRWITREHLVGSIDGANLLLSITDFSIASGRPHAPGFPVCVALLNALVWTGLAPHTAIIVLHIAFSAFAVLFVALLVSHVVSRQAAVVAALLFATNPLSWYYGSVSANLSWEAMLGPLVVLLALRTRGMWWLCAGVFVGLALGVRPSSVALLMPVTVYIVASRSARNDLAGIDLYRAAAGVFAGVLAWMPATVIAQGGEGAFLRSIAHGSSIATAANGAVLASAAIVLLWAVNIGILYLVGGVVPAYRRVRTLGRRSAGIIGLLWVIPPLALLPYASDASPFVVLMLPAITVALAWCVLGDRAATHTVLDTAMLIAVNVAVFLYVPVVTPPTFATMRPGRRTAEQRALTVVARVFTSDLPSWPRIRDADREVDEAVDVVRYAVGGGSDTTAVLVDPTARQFAPSRLLQIYLPAVRFVEPSTRDDSTVEFFHGLRQYSHAVPDSMFHSRRLLLLTDRRFLQAWPHDAVTPLFGSTHLAIAEVRRDDALRIRRTFESNFVRR